MNATIKNENINYTVKLTFASHLSPQALAELMQDVYDENGVAGEFQFEEISPEEKQITFTRSSVEDGEYILEKIHNGEEINDAVLTEVAGEQLLAELVGFDGAKELLPIFQKIENGDFILEGVEKLRPQVVAWVTNDQSYKDAEKIANEKGKLTVFDANKNQSHQGRLIGVTDHHAVISLGRSAFIIDRGPLNVEDLGQDLKVTFNGPKTSIVPIEKNKDKGIGDR